MATQSVQPSTPSIHVFHTERLQKKALSVVQSTDPDRCGTRSGSECLSNIDLVDGGRAGLYQFSITVRTQGVYTLTVWICPQYELELCNATQAANVTFTVCQTHALIETLGEEDVGKLVEGARLDECVCEAGYFGDHGGSPRLCHACSRGTYASEIGSLACEDCSAGTFCDCNSHHANVDACSEGVYPACTQCAPCSKGRFQDKRTLHPNECHMWHTIARSHFAHFAARQSSCKQCGVEDTMYEGFHCDVSGMTRPIANKVRLTPQSAITS